MCLYPRFIRNRKYIANKKNGGVVPPVPDIRVLTVPIGCQKCMECMRQKARQWQARLSEEVRDQEHSWMVNLSFSDEALEELSNRINFDEDGIEIDEPVEGYELDNKIAKLAMRRFLERWRKKHGRSVKHWFVTENDSQIGEQKDCICMG